MNYKIFIVNLRTKTDKHDPNGMGIILTILFWIYIFFYQFALAHMKQILDPFLINLATAVNGPIIFLIIDLFPVLSPHTTSFYI